MKKRLIAGLLVAAVLGGTSGIPAQASCQRDGECVTPAAKSVHLKKKLSSAKAHKTPVTHAATPAKRVHVASGSARAVSLHKSHASDAALAIPAARGAAQGNVVSLIKAMAPGQGVPTWFALRIAHVESNYNAHLRGAAGEYGVFQMKCATARDIGFRGNCAELLDARTNIRWGLKHLALAIGRSDGNLRLAASKHNGGLARRTLVPTYVARVF